jgi:glutathione S-transferase
VLKKLTLCRAKNAGRLGVDVKAEYPALNAWLERIASRPAVVEGVQVPKK